MMPRAGSSLSFEALGDVILSCNGIPTMGEHGRQIERRLADTLWGVGWSNDTVITHPSARSTRTSHGSFAAPCLIDHIRSRVIRSGVLTQKTRTSIFSSIRVD